MRGQPDSSPASAAPPNPLPPRLETEEWVSLTGKDGIAYRDAVHAGNFMAMRRAAFAPGNAEDSAKLRRLLDITDEAIQDGRKVVVFSFFRDVLSTVAAALGETAIGPITGGVPPAKRQALVDEFTARQSPSVLVSRRSKPAASASTSRPHRS